MCIPVPVCHCFWAPLVDRAKQYVCIYIYTQTHKHIYIYFYIFIYIKTMHYTYNFSPCPTLHASFQFLLAPFSNREKSSSHYPSYIYLYAQSLCSNQSLVMLDQTALLSLTQALNPARLLSLLGPD